MQGDTKVTHAHMHTGTCILFGDGCGAVLVQAAPSGESGCSLLSFSMNSDGAGAKHLHALYCGQGNKPYSNGHASSPGAYSNIAMNGQEVFKFAVRAVPTVIEAALTKGGLTKEDIDWLVLHQVGALHWWWCATSETTGKPAHHQQRGRSFGGATRTGGVQFGSIRQHERGVHSSGAGRGCAGG